VKGSGRVDADPLMFPGKEGYVGGSDSVDEVLVARPEVVEDNVVDLVFVINVVNVAVDGGRGVVVTAPEGTERSMVST